MVINAAIFILVFGIIWGFYWAYVVVPESRARATWRKRLVANDSPSVPRPDQSVIRETRASSLDRLNRLLLSRQHITRRLQKALDRAGMRVTPGAVVLACCCCGLVFFLIFGRAPFGLNVVAALVGGYLPLLYLRYAQRARRNKYEELFPEAVEVIARALRAGHSFTTALAIAADEIADPVSSDFKLLYDWQNYGRPLDEALRAFADRAPILDARFFVTAVLTQRETGGNLSEVLDNLVAVIRDRFAVKRQVRVLTAQGRLSGWILAAAPPALAALLLLINPEHLLTFVRDPIGLQMLVAAGVLQIIGTILIRRVVNVEY